MNRVVHLYNVLKATDEDHRSDFWLALIAARRSPRSAGLPPRRPRRNKGSPPHRSRSTREGIAGKPDRYHVHVRRRARRAAVSPRTYRVFVGVVDADEQLMWTDDHDPPTPDEQWKPQSDDHVHAYRVRPGLSVRRRRGDSHGPLLDEYTEAPAAERRQHRTALRTDVARLQLLPQTENVFTVYQGGMAPGRSAGQNSLVEWQWTKKDGNARVQEPRKPMPSSIWSWTIRSSRSTKSRQSRSRSAGQTVDQFSSRRSSRCSRRFRSTLHSSARRTWPNSTSTVSKTFVPAADARRQQPRSARIGRSSLPRVHSAGSKRQPGIC